MSEVTPPGELAVDEPMLPEVEHMYVSTYCQHSLHERCRLICKMCAAACLCPCHRPPPPGG